LGSQTHHFAIPRLCSGHDNNVAIVDHCVDHGLSLTHDTNITFSFDGQTACDITALASLFHG
jgi:hypothetical protein